MVEGTNGEALQQAKDALEQILTKMGLEADVTAQEGEDQLELEVVGEGADQLAGQRGQLLDALQLVLGKMISQQQGRNVRVGVDAMDYRDSRAQSLREMAMELKDKAIESGQVIAINPLSARDRRVMHMALKEVEGVSTESEGETLEKKLLIVPGN